MNLVVGKTSQLANYFPDDYIKISSRDINLEEFKNQNFESVYICFAEQRTYIQDDLNLFIKTNVIYTLKIISFFSKISDRVVVYGTSELWNKYSGGIDISLAFDYNYTPYIESKKLMIDKIESANFNNVVVIHPYNFNSIYRKGDFLFGKIFKSIINDENVEIGNTYYYRELLHPRYIVERSILAKKDEIVGSGRLTFVNDFIRDLYSHFKLNYNKLIKENIMHNLNVQRNINYLNSNNVYTYNELLSDTIKDIEIKKKVNNK